MPVLVASEPPAYNYTEGSTEQTEFLAHTISLNLWNMSAESHVLQVSTEADKAAFQAWRILLAQATTQWHDSCKNAVIASRDPEIPLEIAYAPWVGLPSVSNINLYLDAVKISQEVTMQCDIIRNKLLRGENSNTTDLLDILKILLGRKVINAEGKEELRSLMKEVVERQHVMIDFNDGALRFFPGSLSIDVDQNMEGG